MDKSTNDTWIDKLIDELVDTKDEITALGVLNNQSNILLEIIFNCSRLNYDGDSLRINNEDAIFQYLKVICPEEYKARLDALKAERQAEIAIARARHKKEVAATSEEA